MPAVILLASLFFVSCEDPGKIGLDVNPKNGAILTKYKEFVLPSTQVQFDPRSTLNSFSFQAGEYTDPDFGTIKSKSYTWLGVQTTTPTLSETAEYVNTTLSIQFSSIYGSEGENGKFGSFEVYQLADPIIDGNDYTRVDELGLGSLLGNIEILIQENDTLQTDSLFSFTLSDAFGQAIFDRLEANDPIFENDTLFNAFFKGIAIIPSGGNNKILQFNPTTFSVKLNYTEVNSASEIVERTYSFTLGDMRFFNLTSDLGGTPLSNMLPDNQERDPSDDFRYVQAGTMIALKVSLDPLFMFLDTIENIIVQKAFLTIGDIPSNRPGSSIPFSLNGFFTDESNTWPALAEVSTDTTSVFVILQNEFISSTFPVFPGYYDVPQEIFLYQLDSASFNKATMSNYIQNLHNGGYDTSETPLEQNGELILFTPTSSSQPESSPSHAVTNFFKTHKDSIRLKIYYSIPNL